MKTFPLIPLDLLAKWIVFFFFFLQKFDFFGKYPFFNSFDPELNFHSPLEYILMTNFDRKKLERNYSVI